MRKHISVGVVIASLLASVGLARAACLGNYEREVVAQVTDVTFVAGVPETKTLNPVYSVWLSPGAPFFDCGGIARSMTAGVTLIESYGTPGTVHLPGDWGGVSVSAWYDPERMCKAAQPKTSSGWN